MTAHHRKTRETWDEPGHAHFVTYSCVRRLPLLSKDRTRRWVVEAIECVRSELRVAVWAYVIMPEHVHLLIHPQDARFQMRRILAGLKRSVSDHAKRHLETEGRTDWLRRLTVSYPSRRVFRFWQPGGGFDHNIFREKTVPAVIDYIQANPVRRGLVRSPTDWEWSSARFWAGHPDVPIRMDSPNS